MSRPQLDKVIRPGDPYSAGEQNEIRREARRNRTVVPAGRAASQHAAGLYVDGPRIGEFYAQAPSGGITARYSGEATPYKDIVAGELATGTVTVHNVQPDDVPSGSVLLTVDRRTNRILTWSCAAAPTAPMST